MLQRKLPLALGNVTILGSGVRWSQNLHIHANSPNLLSSVLKINGKCDPKCFREQSAEGVRSITASVV
jgi:hypothetical protein